MPSISSNGHTVDYDRTGAGPAVLLLHGTGATKDTNWGGLPESLASDFTVLSPDLPGSGASTGPAVLTVESTVAGLRAVVDDAGAGPVHVVGYSLGAALGVALAAEHEDLVSSLTLVAGYARADTHLSAEVALWQRAHRADPEVLVRLLFLTGMGPAFWDTADPATLDAGVQGFLQILPAGFERQAALNAVVDTTGSLGSISVPTLVVGLEHDHVVPPEHARRLARAIPGATHRELDAGHLVPWENPSAFAEVVTGHLRAQPVST